MEDIQNISSDNEMVVQDFGSFDHLVNKANEGIYHLQDVKEKIIGKFFNLNESLCKNPFSI